MEISLKSNLITKVLAVILVISLILVGSALFSTVKAADEGENNQVVTENQNAAKPEIKLNRKIQFTGNTYKSYKDGAKVRKTYNEGQIGEGVILRIRNSGAHRIYVAFEGWISDDQVYGEPVKYIDLTFDLSNLKEEGLKTGIKIDGEFLDVDIKNAGVVKFEDGILKPSGHLEGTTDIVFTKKDGTEIPVVAETHNGNITLSVQEGMLSGDLAAKATLFDKVVVKVGEEENPATGQITLSFGEGTGTLGANANIDVKLETMDGKEIAGLNVEASGAVQGDLANLSVNAGGNVTESIRALSGKIRAALTERAKVTIDKEKISGTVGGKASVQDKELVDGDLGVAYKWDEEDPYVGIKGSVLGGNEIEKIEKIPVVSKIKALLSRMPALVK